MSIKGRNTMEHERVAFNLARIKKGGKNFEVAIDPDLAIDHRNGKDVPLRDAVRSDKIFHDVSKGELAAETDLAKLFGTRDFEAVAERILKEGELQLTAEHRAKLREAKRRKVIDMIARNAMDPKTKLPHPPARIESAMEEAKVKVDEYKSPEDQIEGIIKELRRILPISMELKKIEVTIPAQHAGKGLGAVQRFAKPAQEKWGADGSYHCVVEIPAGLEADFYDRINRATEGYVETNVLK